jgi:hypothetical protein
MGNCYTFPRYLALDWHRESDRFECQVGDANVEAEVRHDVEVNERRGRARAAVLGPCPASRYSILALSTWDARLASLLQERGTHRIFRHQAAGVNQLHVPEVSYARKIHSVSVCSSISASYPGKRPPFTVHT